MNADKKLVRDTWNFNCDFPDKARLISLLTGTIDFSREKALAAAAAFTRERLEEIRQLREEIACVIRSAEDHRSVITAERNCDSPADESWFDAMNGEVAAFERTIGRLKFILADKTRGMKGEA